jgi:hypothetical protein
MTMLELVVRDRSAERARAGGMGDASSVLRTRFGLACIRRAGRGIDAQHGATGRSKKISHWLRAGRKWL